MNLSLLRCLGLLALALPVGGQAADFKAYTEDWAPYNFEQDGQVKGIATDLLRAACTQAKLECEIELVPWARAYQTAQIRPNSLVYTTARKPARESEFLWVGPIAPRTTWVYGRSGLEKTIRSAADLSSLQVGVVRGEAAQQDLEKAGVPATALRVESSNEVVMRLLRQGVIDAMVETEIGVAWSQRNGDLAPGSVVRLFKLSDEGAYFYALNKGSDPVRVKRLQAAVETLTREGKLEAIKREYGAHK